MDSFFPRKLKIKISLDITPLVDIVFLLIAFFMLTSSLGKDHVLKVNLPKSETSQEMKSENMVIAIAQDGKISVDDQVLDKKKYEEQLRQLLKKKEKDLKVIIRGDKKSHYEKIVSIMDILSSAGIHNFSLAIEKNRK